MLVKEEGCWQAAGRLHHPADRNLMDACMQHGCTLGGQCVPHPSHPPCPPHALACLQKMGPEAALRGLDDFARNDPRSMRSVTAYLIGCLKQYQEVRLGLNSCFAQAAGWDGTLPSCAGIVCSVAVVRSMLPCCWSRSLAVTSQDTEPNPFLLSPHHQLPPHPSEAGGAARPRRPSHGPLRPT